MWIQVSAVFLALSCAPANAAITWDAPYDLFQYRVEHVGSFYHSSIEPKFGISGDDTEESVYGAAASASLVEEFGIEPGRISLNGTANGPFGRVSPANGLEVQAFVEILPVVLTGAYGVDVAQQAVSFVTRRFRVTSSSNKIKANPSGVVNFNDFGSGFFKATHSVEGNIGMSLFVGWMVLSRLAGMGFSQEGRNYWVLKASPVRPGQLLLAKFLVAYLPARAWD